jgi:hypothetical protein
MKIHNKASMAALAVLVGFSLPAVAFADGGGAARRELPSSR